MSRQATSLNNLTATALNREIGSKYDNVKIVADNISILEDLAAVLDTGVVNEAVALFTTELRANIAAIVAIESDITAVANNEADISSVAANIADINSVAANMADILNAVNIIENLTASATTLEHTESATATLVGTDIELGIPKGVPGNDGYTPVVEIRYDEITGNLEYEVTGYQDSNGLPIITTVEEW